jgi:phage host-nuclease inhibitor protein Gam
LPATARKPKAKAGRDTLARTLAAATAKLTELARLERELGAIESAAAAELEKLRERAGAKTTPLRKKIESLEADLKKLVEKNRAAIFPDDRKSMKLAAGTIGFRQVTSVEVDEKTIELIEKRGRADEAIKIKKEVIKSVLHGWSVKDLKTVKAKKSVVDEFFHRLPKVEVEP